MERTERVRITSVQFHRFKAFARYSLTLDRMNILVGPNNSGKSTVIGALRVLANALRVARNKAPDAIRIGETRTVGYRLSESTLPISLENVHTDYATTDSEIVFNLSNGNRLRLLFPEAEGCVLIPDAQGVTVRTAAGFKSHFPISLTVVPVLGPVEHREQVKQKDTVVGGVSTHRASRHFRSYWYHFREGFADFSQLVSATWPGMEIQMPELSGRDAGELAMYCLENRMTRELYWVGFGFQIWCQLLTHLSRATESSLVVVDEPEVYLHPDVQRQLLGILRDVGPDVLFATHSTEIMAEADPTEIILIDKKRSAGERLRDVSGQQRAMTAVGSIQNITLSALARNRRVLYVEGDDDFRLLRRFARRLGLTELGAGIGITPLDSGGFGSWKNVTTLAAGISEALGVPLMIAAIYDRDYHCDEEICHVQQTLARHLQLAHVHRRKEIENYLLIPSVLDRAIERAIAERASRIGRPAVTAPKAEKLLVEITDPLRDDIQSQYIARRSDYLRSGGADAAVLTRETLKTFRLQWDDIGSRLMIVPGKDVLAALRARVHELVGITLTEARILESMHRTEIPDDLVALLTGLETFRKAEAPVATVE